ncbi:MAG: Mce-associated rane protein [Mycobacterium sp.]|jgi:Mce-associated membrane protein|nr:Mce-associated rane protein [Mycobacterium sp.]
MSRRAGDPTDADSVDETPAEPVESDVVEIKAEVADSTTDADEPDPDTDEPASDAERTTAGRRIQWSRAIAYGLVPALAFLLVSAAGYLKWQDASLREAQAARAESVRAAIDSTVALLSYRADTVDKDLEAAKTRLTGTFLTAYASLTHDVVIPGAKQKQISAVATVPAAASTSVTAGHAVVVVFVNQTIIIGQGAPTSTASSVRVTLDKVDGRWLISQFDPV